jgi:hypothetical protein
MSTAYKYVERTVESQVNWAEVGRDITTMLDDETKIREEKKAAIQKAFQDDMEQLANAPQGKWQDGNATTNNFAHDMMEQKLIDNRLLKSGKMKLRDYTLRDANYNSQTKILFDLQKTLQAERENTIDLYQKGKIQALNISNQADVEAYKVFKDSKAIIDPLSANISMGLYEDQVIDGKTVRVLKKSTPVNVLMGQIVQKIPTLQIEEIMNKWVPTVGTQKDYIYQIATNSKAGSIVELMGVGALDNLEKEHPELKGKLGDYKKVIDDFNLSLTKQIQAWLPTPYQVGSILTENLGGKYNADSYIWDENIAKADKTKILKKVDPLTGLVTLDENAPHYKEQKKEAEDWIRQSLLNKFDQERNIKVTSTTPYAPQVPEYQYKAGQDKKDSMAAAGAWNQIYTGKTAAEKQAALDILLGTPKAQEAGLIGLDLSTAGVIKLSYDNPKKNRDISMIDKDGNPISLADFAAKGVELHGVVDRDQAVKAGGGGTGYGTLSDWTNIKSNRQGAAPQVQKIVVTPDIFSAKSQDAKVKLEDILPQGFVVKDTGGTFGNSILITAPDGKTYPFDTDLSTKASEYAVEGLQQFIERHQLPPCKGGKGRDKFGNCID